MIPEKKLFEDIEVIHTKYYALSQKELIREK